jgi:hypothetical protein
MDCPVLMPKKGGKDLLCIGEMLWSCLQADLMAAFEANGPHYFGEAPTLLLTFSPPKTYNRGVEVSGRDHRAFLRFS